MKEVKTFETDLIKNLRGRSKSNFIKELIKKNFTNKNLKVAFVLVFDIAEVLHFNFEIKNLLVKDIFTHIPIKSVDDNDLSIVCKIIHEHDFN